MALSVIFEMECNILYLARNSFWILPEQSKRASKKFGEIKGRWFLHNDITIYAYLYNS